LYGPFENIFSHEIYDSIAVEFESSSVPLGYELPLWLVVEFPPSIDLGEEEGDPTRFSLGKKENTTYTLFISFFVVLPKILVEREGFML
jgi:hypothetical protein